MFSKLHNLCYDSTFVITLHFQEKKEDDFISQHNI